MRYHVIGLVDATVTVEVEADTPEAALERAYEDERMHVSVCHQCAREVQVGEVYAARVIDDDGAGDEVLTDEQPRLELATVEQLKAELAKRAERAERDRDLVSTQLAAARDSRDRAQQRAERAEAEVARLREVVDAARAVSQALKKYAVRVSAGLACAWVGLDAALARLDGAEG